ncbi:YciI family protein [Blastococcus sp. SYSU D00813]
MRFMVMAKATADTEAGVIPPMEDFEAMLAYQEEMLAAGVLVDRGHGLKPSATGARVRFSGSERTVIDGPFAETKELLVGYMILEVSSLEEAVEWVKRSPDVGGDGEVEIRPVYTDEDFGDSVTPEMAAADDALQQTLAERR